MEGNQVTERKGLRVAENVLNVHTTADTAWLFTLRAGWRVKSVALHGKRSMEGRNGLGSIFRYTSLAA